MRGPRIGVVGLGSMAQRVYLPILTNQQGWTLVGGFSRRPKHRLAVCEAYRIGEFPSLPSLLAECDAVFVHTPMESHFDIVSSCLQNGVDVYVDKPLATSVQQAQQLVDISAALGRKLMVGFNRRFAPAYVRAQQLAKQPNLIMMSKLRVSPYRGMTVAETMLDDYIHAVDTVLWLAGEVPISVSGHIATDEVGRLTFAHHTYLLSRGRVATTAMNHQAGIDTERLELFVPGETVRVEDLDRIEVGTGGETTVKSSHGRVSAIELRGFGGAVRNFIHCLIDDKTPAVSGQEGLRAQQTIEDMITMSEGAIASGKV